MKSELLESLSDFMRKYQMGTRKGFRNHSSHQNNFPSNSNLNNYSNNQQYGNYHPQSNYNNFMINGNND
jgi:hypothetical protein